MIFSLNKLLLPTLESLWSGKMVEYEVVPLDILSRFRWEFEMKPRQKVLIVDDDPGILDLVAECMPDNVNLFARVQLMKVTPFLKESSLDWYLRTIVCQMRMASLCF